MSTGCMIVPESVVNGDVIDYQRAATYLEHYGAN